MKTWLILVIAGWAYVALAVALTAVCGERFADSAVPAGWTVLLVIAWMSALAMTIGGTVAGWKEDS